MNNTINAFYGPSHGAAGQVSFQAMSSRTDTARGWQRCSTHPVEAEKAGHLYFAASTPHASRLYNAKSRCRCSPTSPVAAPAGAELQPLSDQDFSPFVMGVGSQICNVASLSFHLRHRRAEAFMRGTLNFCCKVLVVAGGIILGTFYSESGIQRPEAVLSPVPQIVPTGYGREEQLVPPSEELAPAPSGNPTEIAFAATQAASGEPVHTGGRTPDDPVADEIPLQFVYV